MSQAVTDMARSPARPERPVLFLLNEFAALASYAGPKSRQSGLQVQLTTYNAAPRAMSKALNAIVVSVEYRHAPEFKFPAQHDAVAAYGWTL